MRAPQNRMMNSASLLTDMSRAEISAAVEALRQSPSVMADRRGAACPNCLRVGAHARLCPMAGREDLRSRESD